MQMGIFLPTIFPPICSCILLSEEALAAVSLYLEFLQLCSVAYMLEIQKSFSNENEQKFLTFNILILSILNQESSLWP